MKRKPRQEFLFPTADDQPTKARPGSAEKLEVLRERVANGEELWHPEDRKLEDENLR